MNKTILVGSAVVLISIVSVLGYVIISKSPFSSKRYPTYFSYSDETLSKVNRLSTDHAITTDDIIRIDGLVYQLVAKNSQNKSLTEDPSKVYAYVMMAERDFAFLSHGVSGKWKGSLDPVVKEVLCMFFTSDCPTLSLTQTDPYSQALSDLVMAKVKEKRALEKEHTRSYEILRGKGYWGEAQTSTSSIKNLVDHGWFIKSADQFRPEAPPAFDSLAFKEEQRIVKEYLDNVTPEQKLTTVLWTAGPGSKMAGGIMIERATEYMQEKKVPLQKMFFIRSLLAAAMDDANTASYDAKYIYQVKRPYMVDPSLKPIIPTFNSPSFPSGQATLAGAVQAVLMRFFPNDASKWEKQTEDAGMSRVWGGIHYQMDHEAGKKLGMDVAGEALTSADAFTVDDN